MGAARLIQRGSALAALERLPRSAPALPGLDLDRLQRVRRYRERMPELAHFAMQRLAQPTGAREIERRLEHHLPRAHQKRLERIAVHVATLREP